MVSVAVHAAVHAVLRHDDLCIRYIIPSLSALSQGNQCKPFQPLQRRAEKFKNAIKTKDAQFPNAESTCEDFLNRPEGVLSLLHHLRRLTEAFRPGKPSKNS